MQLYTDLAECRWQLVPSSYCPWSRQAPIGLVYQPSVDGAANGRVDSKTKHYGPQKGPLNNNSHLSENCAIPCNNGAVRENTHAEGPWPIDHPLPVPTWAAEDKAPLKFTTIWEYEEMASNIEFHVQKLLEEHNYNTVGNFLSLYEGFKRSGCSGLSEFYQSYTPPVTSAHHTCVGLALELWKKLYVLDNAVTTLTDHLYLVSCEEGVDSLDYVALYEDLVTVANVVEKEHVLLALKFEIGNRAGTLLCDPGYHIGRVITVMYDQQYPHTGWFIQSEENNLQKEYCYTFSAINGDYIEWTERNLKMGVSEIFTALIYIKRPYLTAVDVTERRNLVYNFRSLLSRDTKGHLIAGIYFKLKETSSDFTIFYQDGGKQRLKMNFAMFLYPELVNEGILKIISKCNDQLKLQRNGLLNILQRLAMVLNDKIYLGELLDINNCINNMTDVN